jgi:hypothetical protein
MEFSHGEDIKDYSESSFEAWFKILFPIAEKTAPGENRG